jgi:GAF domain-containing protein
MMELYQQAYEHAMKMIDAGRSMEETLSTLTHAAERVAGPDTVSSILLLDNQGLLRNAASPRLPLDYLKAIDGLKPHAKIGTCAAAAATGTMVVTEDFYDDSKWAELRHLPLALGFKGGWSMPITNAEGKVLGTFGTYFRKKRVPIPIEVEGIALLARAAAEAVMRRKRNQSMG